MEERVSGFHVRGFVDEVVAHGERIARALRESDVDAVALAEWDDWRPKAHFENDLVSANIRETTRLENGTEFVVDVHFDDDQLKQEVGQRLDRSNGTGQESP